MLIVVYKLCNCSVTAFELCYGRQLTPDGALRLYEYMYRRIKPERDVSRALTVSSCGPIGSQLLRAASLLVLRYR